MATPKPSSSEQGEAETFDPNDLLLGIIGRIVEGREPVLIYVSSIGAIAVCPVLGLFLTELSRDELVAFYQLPASRYAIKRLEENSIKQLVDQGVPARNIDELQWCAAYYTARGRLMKGCGRDDVVLLKSWPNLTRLPCSPNAVRIAALLTRYPTTVALAHRLLKIPMAEMNDFYSAAMAAGLAVAVNRKPEQPVAEIAPHRSRGLLGALFERVLGM